MELTIKFISDNFDKFNNLYWGGKLKRPDFEIMHRKNLLGQFCYGRGKWLMRISDKFARSEKDYLNTILHESIHLYIRQNNIKDTRKHHGQVFYNEADRLNKYGWHIARTDSVAGVGLTNNQGEIYNVACFKDSKGHYFLMCMNPKKVDYFKRNFDKYTDFYKEWFMFTSTDDKKYASFAKCTCSNRGRFLTKDEYEQLKNENPNAKIHQVWTMRHSA